MTAPQEKTTFTGANEPVLSAGTSTNGHHALSQEEGDLLVLSDDSEHVSDLVVG